MRQHLTLLAIVLTIILASFMSPTGTLPIAAQEFTPAASPAATPTPFTGQTFVGQTSDPETFVAVVVAEPAADGAERQTQAYLSDATTIDAWFTGTTAGDRLDLSAEDGARLEATRGDQGVEGTATLADGTSLTFTARPAAGIAGLYTLTIDEEGQLDGNSSTGGELAGQVEAGVSVSTGTPAPGFRLVMTVVDPEGETTEIEATVQPATEVEAGTARLIVLEDGQLRGKRTKDGKGDQGFIDPTADE